MKVFLTVEKEKGDDRKDSDHVIGKCMDFIEVLETNGVPNQFKVTSLPRRYRGFKPLSEMSDIEP